MCLVFQVMPKNICKKNEYKYIYVGENLAMNFNTSNSVHNALMQSLTHKKNILNTQYKDIGLNEEDIKLLEQIKYNRGVV